MAGDGERSPWRWALLALAVVGFPVAWPASAIRDAVRRRRWETLRARRGPAHGELLERVRRGDVARAQEHVLSTSTMASGREDTALLELTFGDGSSVVAEGSRELRDALRGRSVHVPRTEARDLGIAAPFGWGLWIASVLGLSAAVSGSGVALVLAVIVLCALVWLAFS